MKTLGLTGSIGMGKSATAAMFRAAGIPVYDADAEVHALYERGGAAVGPLSERFKGIVQDEAVHRPALREAVLGNVEAMSDLEAIVHPLVGAAQVTFRQAAQAAGSAFIVLDIPLLFETGGDKNCDLVAVVTASASIQRRRVLGRKGMTEDVFNAILSKQMSDADKRARADLVISTAFGFDFTRAHVEAIIDLLNRPAESLPDD
ncbi:MAG: dephospho-CoA kinase [Henriciella sp.]|nr:dephospho-CoA kinase [Henriciella sp.]